jgi:uncharacterized protein (DUF1810 family)
MQPTDDLSRFKTAQEGIYEHALSELRAGVKRTHWMWFVFPQMAGLGRSETARFYGIGSLSEARAYLADETLGHRLREATIAMLSHPGKSLNAILGHPDDLKFVSSMTLFDAAAPHDVFGQALEIFTVGARDEKTLRLVNSS